MDSVLEIILLVSVGLFVGVINTLAGGGSLISLPLLIFLGLPPAVANGTNRVAILIQNTFGVAGFKSKGIDFFTFGKWAALAALFGAMIGAQIAVDIKGEVFNRILAVVMVLVVIYMLIPKKKLMAEIPLTKKRKWWSVFLFFFIGIYGGFIQAGVGFLILLILSNVNQFTLVKSNAVKMFVVLVYMALTVAIFAYNDKINWKYGITMSIGNGTGAWLASRYAVKKGDQIVKVFLIVMVFAMAIKLWFF
ncbi:MAG: sulfite exporter TauE/SafE family protein [Flavobacteriaceae bacterium]|nr:sulfite exporter TauE/SafE family protein [Flavobacteriaceae bacterium]